jgi:dimethylglycine dehydrogenase
VFFCFRVDEMRYQMSRQGWNQAPQMMMTPDEVKELVPIIDIEKANVKKVILTL